MFKKTTNETINPTIKLTIRWRKKKPNKNKTAQYNFRKLHQNEPLNSWNKAQSRDFYPLFTASCLEKTSHHTATSSLLSSTVVEEWWSGLVCQTLVSHKVLYRTEYSKVRSAWQLRFGPRNRTMFPNTAADPQQMNEKRKEKKNEGIESV